MSLVRRIARPALAAPFVVEGVRTAVSPDRDIEVAPSAFAQADRALEQSSTPSFVDSRVLVRVSGAVAAAAGVAYAVGKKPRLAAGVLLATTSVGLAGRKKVWQLKGDERTAEIQSILKDLGLLGGVMLAVVDRDGRPSLSYRWDQYLDKASKDAEASAEKVQKKADKAADRATAKLDATRG